MRAHSDPLHAGAAVVRETGEEKSLAGLVGPNAIIQTEDALCELLGAERCAEVFRAAGLSNHLDAEPSHMVSEQEAARLFRSICDLHGGEAAAVLRLAGLKTGDYILAHRIPALAQRLIGVLPAFAGARVLLSAIGRHAWTFAGSGVADCEFGRRLRISIAGNPLASPGCPWHLAVFERLFATLVSPKIRLDHEACCARGDDACRTLIRPTG